MQDILPLLVYSKKLLASHPFPCDIGLWMIVINVCYHQFFAFNLKYSLHTIKMITMTFVKRSFLWNHKIYFFMVCSNEEHLLGIVWMLCSCAIYALILLLNARSLPWQLLLLLKYTLWFTM